MIVWCAVVLIRCARSEIRVALRPCVLFRCVRCCLLCGRDLWLKLIVKTVLLLHPRPPFHVFFPLLQSSASLHSTNLSLVFVRLRGYILSFSLSLSLLLSFIFPYIFLVVYLQCFYNQLSSVVSLGFTKTMQCLVMWRHCVCLCAEILTYLWSLSLIYR